MSIVDSILSSERKKPEFYEALGCDRSSTHEQIQAEYRARVRNVHPDKNLDENEAHQKFADLQTAYSTLVDNSKRRLYDSWLDSPIPGNFEEFTRNADVIQMSTHWAAPKQTTPMIQSGGPVKPKPEEKASKWDDGRRYESSIASKFRSYQL